MKTTIYELLGMIKDDKAPKKIVFKEDIYEYRCSDCIDYYCDKDGYWLFDDYDITDILNDEVEILETTITMRELVDNSKINELVDKYKKWQKETKPDKIEKLGFENCTTPKSANENEAFLMTCINFASMKIDEIIEAINER